jgi:AraC-like DNA-binding protein
MKSDSSRPAAGPTALDPIARAHLKEPGDASHVMYRYPADPGFDGLLQFFWIPVWSVPPGREAPQRVLQYPVSLVVVSADYARFYGVVPGLSTTTLTGNGWAVGVMCAPAAGALVAGGPMSAYTDRYVDVAEVLGAAGERLTARVRAAMAPDPHSPEAHAEAIAAFGDALSPFLPVDDDGLLVNEVVAYVEGDREVVRVAQVCERFGLSERALQRLVHRRLGLTPKWLIQRRRLQEAAERLRAQPAGLGDVAALLGYADQAHFTRDFARVTDMTPGRFAARHASGS